MRPRVKAAQRRQQRLASLALTANVHEGDMKDMADGEDECRSGGSGEPQRWRVAMGVLEADVKSRRAWKRPVVAVEGREIAHEDRGSLHGKQAAPFCTPS